MKDLNKNKNSIYVMMGASNHSDDERQAEDFYATEPKAIKILLEVEKFNNNIWECACGQGHLSKELEMAGFNVQSTDLIDRGYGTSGVNFLEQIDKYKGDIITNPPYKHAKEFIYKALELVFVGNKVAMFLRVQFLESKKRKKLFLKYPPKIVYISSSRLNCAKDADFDKHGINAVAYAWYIWEKGHTGETILKWIN